MTNQVLNGNLFSLIGVENGKNVEWILMHKSIQIQFVKNS